MQGAMGDVCGRHIISARNAFTGGASAPCTVATVTVPGHGRPAWNQPDASGEGDGSHAGYEGGGGNRGDQLQLGASWGSVPDGQLAQTWPRGLCSGTDSSWASGCRSGTAGRAFSWNRLVVRMPGGTRAGQCVHCLASPQDLRMPRFLVGLGRLWAKSPGHGGRPHRLDPPGRPAGHQGRSATTSSQAGSSSHPAGLCTDVRYGSVHACP